MAVGTIRSLRPERGFGFISPDAGNDDVFFHHSAVVDSGFDQLQEGQRVSYEEGADPRDPKRRRAVDVRPEAQ